MASAQQSMRSSVELEASSPPAAAEQQQRQGQSAPSSRPAMPARLTQYAASTAKNTSWPRVTP